MNPNVCFNARIVNNGCSCISPRISDQRFAMHSDSLHTDNNWNNWFHFQYDRLWPVNMTGKTKSWLVNSPISPDIVRWPAVISSPVIGHRIDYNGVGSLRGQRHIPSNTPSTPPRGAGTSVDVDDREKSYWIALSLEWIGGLRVICGLSMVFRRRYWWERVAYENSRFSSVSQCREKWWH